MIRAVVWKELREQGLIAVMLAALGGALIAAAAAFADPPSKTAASTDVVAALGAGRLLALMLVVTAGMVCGGALFAAEKEAGTMTFLDTLPTRRWLLWRAKLVAGLVLAGAVVAVLLGATAALEVGDGPFVRRLVVYALLAFAWGTLGSTLARTTLGSVGVAIAAATLAAFAFLFPIVLFLSGPGGPRPIGWALFEVLMLAAPLALSAWRFTAPDRARAATAPSGERTDAGAGWRSGLGLGALAWLTFRQLRVTGPVLSVFALAFGLALLLPEMHPLFVWPALALTAGVLAGVTAFGDEQAHRTAVFWGEFRLPVGRAWWVKIGIHLGLLGWLLLLLALPGALRGQLDPDLRAGYGHTTLAAVFRSRLFVELGPQGWKYALVPAAYGFAFGHVCGLLFRKLVVACGVAVMLGGLASAGWGPSLLAGGVSHWQVWLPAAAVLLAGRLIARAWSADRAGDRRSVQRMVGAGAFALAAFAAGIGYRVVEVPDDPAGADDLAHVAALPSYDENVAGNKFRAAAERFARAAA
ncbi:MAG: ABC transporter permease, partial [Planctomycetes bacterium]|nr:ABC transporter permease [Planctomycetota bacterium]